MNPVHRQSAVIRWIASAVDQPKVNTKASTSSSYSPFYEDCSLHDDCWAQRTGTRSHRHVPVGRWCCCWCARATPTVVLSSLR